MHQQMNRLELLASCLFLVDCVKYKVIMYVYFYSQFIPHLLSYCDCVSGPDCKALEFIGKKEGLQLPSEFSARIAEKSNRSLRRAILSLETCRVQQLSANILLIHQAFFFPFFFLCTPCKRGRVPDSFSFCVPLTWL